MVQFGDFSVLLEGHPPFPRGLAEPIPPIPEFNLEMPRVYRRPSPPPLRAARGPVLRLLQQARKARLENNSAEFGKAYGGMTGELRPEILWALSCWEFLLSTQGLRFLARNSHEKLYTRGDYRVFNRGDFEGLAYRSFREVLLAFLDLPEAAEFGGFLRERFWAAIVESYRMLEYPPDGRQRKLTNYSYLRCVPYRFMNLYHHERVYRTLARLPSRLRKPVELYHLSFYREEAAMEKLALDSLEFRRRRWTALRRVASEDFLSFRLLRQIERY